jgi:hypothetical protein
MPYERVARSDAGRWTTLLGFALALIAAGSFIAFSLVARDATSAGPGAAVAAIAPVASAPALTFVQPDASADRPGGDGVRLSSDGRDLVLGTRFFNGPVAGGTTEATTGSGGCAERCGGTKTPDNNITPGVIPTRPSEGVDGKDKNKGGGNGAGHGNGDTSPPAPSPNGKAKGHDKARGKGHDKHPEDH